MADFVSHSLFRRVIARLDCTRIVLKKGEARDDGKSSYHNKSHWQQLLLLLMTRKMHIPYTETAELSLLAASSIRAGESNKSIKRLSFRFCLSPWLASVLSCRLTNNIKTIRQNRMRSAWRMRKPIRHPKDSIRNSLSKGKKKTFGRILPEWKSL